MNKKKYRISLGRSPKIDGQQDVKIDDKKYGILKVRHHIPLKKRKKFGEGGLDEVVREDTFGYASQGIFICRKVKRATLWWLDSN